MLIICVGMPRSSSTLQFNYVMEILRECSELEVYSHGFWTLEHFESNPSLISDYIRDRGVHCVKMHDYSTVFNQVDAKFFCSYRKLLDVAASLKVKFGLSGEELYSSLIKINENFMALKKLQPNKVLFQDYEKLSGSNNSVITEMTSFLNLYIDDIGANRIQQKFNLDNVRALGSNFSKFDRLKVKVFKLLMNSQFKKILAGLISSNKFKKKVRGFFIVQHQDYLFHPNHISKYEERKGYYKGVLSPSDIKQIADINASF